VQVVDEAEALPHLLLKGAVDFTGLLSALKPLVERN